MVMGMDGSGASTVSRFFNDLGIPSGSMFSASDGQNDNSRIENSDGLDINDRIFFTLGSSWDDLSGLEKQWWNLLQLKPYKDQLQRILQCEISPCELFVVSDSRIPILLPFWISVLREMEVALCFIIPVRHPLEVAESLKKRNGFSIQKGLLLWMKNMLSIENFSRPFPRSFFRFDAFREHPADVASDITDQFGIHLPDAKLKLNAVAKAFQDRTLKHNHIPSPNIDPTGISLIDRLYTILFKTKMNGELDDDYLLIDEIGREFEKLITVFYNRDIKNTSGSFKKTSAADNMLAQALKERDIQIASLNQEIADRDARIHEFHDVTGNQRKKIRSMEQMIKKLDQELALINQEQKKITSSHSWKLTMPIRFAGRVLRGDWPVIRESINSIRNGRKNSFAIKKTTPAKRDVVLEEEIAHQDNERTLVSEKVSFHGKRILLVSHYCPTRAHAGGLRILDIYSLIKSTFFPDVQLDLYTHKRPEIDWRYEDLEKIFDHVFLSPVEHLSFTGFRQMQTDLYSYDVVDLQFHQAGEEIESWRKIASKVIFTPMESLLRNLIISLRRYDLLPLRELLKKMMLAWEEINIARKADEVVCVSETDASSLRIFCPAKKISALETAVSNLEFADAFDRRYDVLTPEQKQLVILYIAYFGSETNINALKWYLINVHPMISAAVPEYKLQVIGRGDLSAFKEYQSRSVELVGEVPQLTPYICSAKVGIAPALSGGGFRGKINQYSLYGVPVVASTISAQGLAYQNGLDIFAADDSKLFAQQCVRLLRDNELNKEMGRKAREKVFANYTWETKIEAIMKIYDLSEYRRLFEPRVTILVSSFNHSRYLKKRIESIMAQTYGNFELIVIDDCSSDDSVAVIHSLQKTYNFRTIINKSNSGTPFAAWEDILRLTNGDYIWICESDDYADSSFLECAIKEIRRVPEAVIAYCDSWIVDEHDQRIDHTDTYFHDIWRESRWDTSFMANGSEELQNFQLRGQTLPNMSSALISTAGFKKSFRPFIKKFKLTGDWLFVGLLMKHGKVVYFKKTLNYFRKHQNTARARINSSRSQAEFILAKYILFREAKRPVSEFATVVSTDACRFLHETAGPGEVFLAMMKISLPRTLGAGIYLAASLLGNRGYLKKFYNRWQLGKKEAGY